MKYRLFTFIPPNVDIAKNFNQMLKKLLNILKMRIYLLPKLMATPIKTFQKDLR